MSEIGAHVELMRKLRLAATPGPWVTNSPNDIDSFLTGRIVSASDDAPLHAVVVDEDGDDNQESRELIVFLHTHAEAHEAALELLARAMYLLERDWTLTAEGRESAKPIISDYRALSLSLAEAPCASNARSTGNVDARVGREVRDA